MYKACPLFAVAHLSVESCHNTQLPAPADSLLQARTIIPYQLLVAARDALEYILTFTSAQSSSDLFTLYLCSNYSALLCRSVKYLSVSISQLASFLTSMAG